MKYNSKPPHHLPRFHNLYCGLEGEEELATKITSNPGIADASLTATVSPVPPLCYNFYFGKKADCRFDSFPDVLLASLVSTLLIRSRVSHCFVIFEGCELALSLTIFCQVLWRRSLK